MFTILIHNCVQALSLSVHVEVCICIRKNWITFTDYRITAWLGLAGLSGCIWPNPCSLHPFLSVLSLGTNEKRVVSPSLSAQGGLGLEVRSITSLSAIWIRAVLQEVSLLRFY